RSTIRWAAVKASPPAAGTRVRPGGSSPRARRRARPSSPTASFCAVGSTAKDEGVSENHEPFGKEGPVRRREAFEEDRGDEQDQRAPRDEDVGAPFDDLARVRGPHAGGPQRQQVHSGLHHGKHGRTQTGRVRGHADLPRSRIARGEGGGSRGAGEVAARIRIPSRETTTTWKQER